MKKSLLLTMLLMVFGLAVTAQTAGPKLTFEGGTEEYTLDYGTIKKDADPLRKVSFKNTGNEPLVIKNARSTCGCTVPTYPKEPIMPGESSVLEIRYATDRVGAINKKVTITTNDGKDHFINVVGTILPEEKQESVPVKKTNSMIQKGN